MAMQDGAVKDEESIKHSDVLVEDPEEIEKHARNWRNFSSKYWKQKKLLIKPE